jgi:hypothetical protein
MSRFHPIFAVAALALCALPASPAAAAIDVVGRTSATIHWEPAAGPVAYYGIFISRDGKPFREQPNAYALAAFPYYKVKGSFGQTFQFRVAAYDIEQNRGPLSATSEAIRFVEPWSNIQLPLYDPAVGARHGRHDFDGDHVADAVFHDPNTGEVLVLLGGDLEAGAVAIATQKNPGWQVAAALDLDGDGRDDLYWRNEQNGGARIWLMKGREFRELSTPPNSDPRWTVIGSGDFDGNGQDDLLWRHTLYGWVMIWHSGAKIGWGHFEPPVAYPSVTDPEWGVAAVGDFDGNGTDDVFWHRQKSGDTKVWYMEELRHRQLPLAKVAPEVMEVLTAGDFDGDGRDDLFWRETVQGWSEIWFMDGGDSFEAVEAPAVEADWTLLATGDVNGDGRDDLVWTEPTRDRVHRWLMEGALAHDSELR